MEETEFGSSEAASLGGKTRAERMSDEDRSESARKAAEARWAKHGKTATPRATHIGSLKFGDLTIPCAVLENGDRVLSQTNIASVLGVSRGGKQHRLRGSGNGVPRPIFLGSPALKPFITSDLSLVLSNPVKYIVHNPVKPNSGGIIGHGLRAELIAQVCEVWLKAREAGALRLDKQKQIAAKAEVIMRGLARVGIIALVDEATGYQADRARDALAKILEAFIAKELRPWVRTFEAQFYQELFRLKGIEFKGSLKAPRYIGKVTNDLVYDRLAPGVREELNRINPANEKGQRKHKNFQWLSQNIGYQKLKQHLASVTVLMKIFDDWDTFKKNLDKALPRQDAAPLFNLPAPSDA